MADSIGETYLRTVQERLAAYKLLGEHAMAQVYDSGLHRRLSPESNTIAVLVRHLSGNMRSRWTGFLTSDGEKPDRNREAEFNVDAAVTRKEVLQWWEDGWASVFDELRTLRPDDLTRTVSVRGQSYTALEAILVALAHYAYHVGQIVHIARHIVGPPWVTLSFPRQKT
jgi:uncharacterized damage-inducible protein DinB